MQLLNPILFCALAVRLLRLGLHRQLPLFFLYSLANGAISLAILAWLTPRQPLYVPAYIAAQVIFLMLQILCAWEVFRRRTERIYDLGWIGTAVLAVSAAAGCLAAVLTLRSNPTSAWMDAGVEMVHLSARLIRVFLLVTLILSLAFFRLFPISSIRNLAVHVRILCCYFLVQTAAAWLVVFFDRQRAVALSTFLLAAGSLCALAWMLLLRREPDTQPGSGAGGPGVDVGPEAALFEQQVKNAARRLKP